MKKKTVITTETHEVWVVKEETIPKPAGDQTITAPNAIDVTPPDDDLPESESSDDGERNEE